MISLLRGCWRHTTARTYGLGRGATSTGKTDKSQRPDRDRPFVSLAGPMVSGVGARVLTASVIGHTSSACPGSRPPAGRGESKHAGLSSIDHMPGPSPIVTILDGTAANDRGHREGTPVRLIRFRLRTMMIAIALLAVLMGLLMLQFRLIARTDTTFLFAVEFAAIIVLVVPSLLQFYILAAYFWRGPTRHGEFSRTDDPTRRPDHDARGEPKIV